MKTEHAKIARQRKTARLNSRFAATYALSDPYGFEALCERAAIQEALANKAFAAKRAQDREDFGK